MSVSIHLTGGSISTASAESSKERTVKCEKELTAVKNKIQKLKDKKALIDEELEPLLIREEELENEEIIAICRKTISQLQI